MVQSSSLLLALLQFAALIAARAAIVSWTGGNDGDWRNATAWSLGAVPANADTVVISEASVTIDGTDPVAIGSLYLANSSKLEMSANLDFTVNSLLSVQSGSSLILPNINFDVDQLVLDAGSISSGALISTIQLQCTNFGKLSCMSLETGEHDYFSTLYLSDCDLSDVGGPWRDYGPLDLPANSVAGVNKLPNNSVVFLGMLEMAPGSQVFISVAICLWKLVHLRRWFVVHLFDDSLLTLAA